MSPGWVPGPRSPRFSVLAERRFKGGIATGATFQPIASGVKDSCVVAFDGDADPIERAMHDRLAASQQRDAAPRSPRSDLFVVGS